MVVYFMTAPLLSRRTGFSRRSARRHPRTSVSGARLTRSSAQGFHAHLSQQMARSRGSIVAVTNPRPTTQSQTASNLYIRFGFKYSVAAIIGSRYRSPGESTPLMQGRKLTSYPRDPIVLRRGSVFVARSLSALLMWRFVFPTFVVYGKRIVRHW
jgi:hypothetical protein